MYNKDYHTPQYCNGTQWIAFSKVLAGAGTGNCASPVGAEGVIIYNDTSKIMQFCNGKDWVAFGTAASAADTTSNLIAWYKLDDGTGTTATDSASSPHNGTLTNGPTWATGFLGNAVNFDGTNDYIDVPYNAAFNLTGNLTLSAWINPTTVTGQHRIVTLPNDGVAGTELYSILIEDGVAYFWLGCGGDLNINTGFSSTNSWHHIAATVNGTTMALYIDGQIKTFGTCTGGRASHTAGNFAIGRYSAGFVQAFSGMIDDVRVYSRALSANDIHALAGCTTPIGAPQAMMYNKDAKVMQYCNGGQWVAVGPIHDVGVPTGCATIGNVCSDGTVYAGLSPDGNGRMYTTPADATPSGFSSFNNGGYLGGFDTSMVNCTYGTNGGTQSSCTTGRDNTTLLVGLTDAGAPYLDAKYCDDLIAFGHTDWYLPSVMELRIMNINAVAIGGFNTTGIWSDGYYASSSEGDATDENVIQFNTLGDGSGAQNRVKQQSFSFRCVRR